MRHCATLTLEHPKSELIENTLQPESMAGIPRTSIGLTRQGHELSMRIESGDVNGLRAALNSYLRWMDMTTKILDRIGD